MKTPLLLCACALACHSGLFGQTATDTASPSGWQIVTTEVVGPPEVNVGTIEPETPGLVMPPDMRPGLPVATLSSKQASFSQDWPSVPEGLSQRFLPQSEDNLFDRVEFTLLTDPKLAPKQILSRKIEVTGGTDYQVLTTIRGRGTFYVYEYDAAGQMIQLREAQIFKLRRHSEVYMRWRTRLETRSISVALVVPGKVPSAFSNIKISRNS